MGTHARRHNHYHQGHLIMKYLALALVALAMVGCAETSSVSRRVADKNVFTPAPTTPGGSDGAGN